MPKYTTAIDIVQRTCRTIGLPVPATLVGNQDPIAIQMLELLTECGRELMGVGKWQMMSETWKFTTVPGTLQYDLPSDLNYMEPATGWNLTARVPLIGPMTDQQWALLEARQLGGTTLYIQFQVEQDKIDFYFVPDEPQDISIAYTSRGWVRLNEDPTQRSDYVEADGDTVLFDPLLVQMALRLKWRTNKGFDTTAQNREFQSFLDTVRSKDIPAPDLSLSRQAGYPYLGYYNMPDTGFGRSS